MNKDRIKAAYAQLLADLTDEGHELHEILAGAVEHTADVQAAVGAAAAEPPAGEPAPADPEAQDPAPPADPAVGTDKEAAADEGEKVPPGA